jgi:hypothetical protein
MNDRGGLSGNRLSLGKDILFSVQPRQVAAALHNNPERSIV